MFVVVPIGLNNDGKTLVTLSAEKIATAADADTAKKLAYPIDITVSDRQGISGKASFDGSGNITVPLSHTPSTSSNIPGPYGGKFNCTRVGSLVVTTYIRPDNVPGAYPTWTTSNESIPQAFRPITQVESSGTDNKSGMLAISLLPSGRIYLRATTLPAGKGFYVRAPYPAAIS